MTSFFHTLFAFKNLSLSVTLQSLFLLSRRDAAWFQNCSIKPIKSLKCTGLNFNRFGGYCGIRNKLMALRDNEIHRPGTCELTFEFVVLLFSRTVGEILSVLSSALCVKLSTWLSFQPLSHWSEFTSFMLATAGSSNNFPFDLIQSPSPWLCSQTPHWNSC